MYQDIIGAITSVGFPIVACGFMGWFVYDNTKSHRQEVEKLNDQHNEEMKSVTQAVNNNTIVLERLCTLMDKDSEK